MDMHTALLIVKGAYYLPFLGNALRWQTGTATAKDVNSIKTHANHLIETQLAQ